MITIKLKGGLGNQLFQYATARALAVQHQASVAFDLSFLQKREAGSQHTFRDYELGVMGIPPAEPPLLDKMAFGLVNPPAKKLIQSLVRRAIAGKVYNEKSFSYDPDIVSKTCSVTYLNGYFPSERYFKNVESILRSELQFIDQPDTPVSRCIKNSCSVSMHIRRGDYLSNPSARQYHGLCSLDYYQQAVAYIAGQRPDIHIFVFSDDLAWARQHLSFPHPIDFVEGNVGSNSYLDMQLMSLCQHHIIANSSFSWWGAWLNPSPDKIVIAPRRWFADETAQSQTQDIVPDSWIRL